MNLKEFLRERLREDEELAYAAGRHTSRASFVLLRIRNTLQRWKREARRMSDGSTIGHGPTVLSGGGPNFWVECTCGRDSGMRPTITSAYLWFDEHLAAVMDRA